MNKYDYLLVNQRWEERPHGYCFCAEFEVTNKETGEVVETQVFQTPRHLLPAQAANKAKKRLQRLVDIQRQQLKEKWENAGIEEELDPTTIT